MRFFWRYMSRRLKAASCRRDPNWKGPEKPRQGMTLLEVTLAVTILTILAGVVLPFQRLIAKRARELVLRETLRETRRAIDKYRDDHSLTETGPSGAKGFRLVYPAGWEELIQNGYLRRIPLDPMTQERNWLVIPFPGCSEETGRQAGAGGIFDIRSLSVEIAIDGGRYDDW